MRFKNKEKCDKCGKIRRNLHNTPKGFLCYRCYKEITQIIPFFKNTFKEHITRRKQFGLNLTEHQFEFLEKRSKQLKLNSGEYFRILLINDMENNEKSKN